MTQVRIELNQSAEDLTIVTTTNTDVTTHISRSLLRESGKSVWEMVKMYSTYNPSFHVLFVDTTHGLNRIMWDSSQPFAEYSEGYDAGDGDEVYVL